MIFIKKNLMATCPSDTQVVPGVNHHRRSESFIAELPNSTKDQGWHDCQEQPRSALVQCMQHTKADRRQQIGLRQWSETEREFFGKPTLQSKSENGFFSDRRNQHQCDKTQGFTGITTQDHACLDRKPCTDGAYTISQSVKSYFSTVLNWSFMGHGWRMIAAAVLFTPILSAFAGLGEHESSIHADTVRMHARRAVAALPLYSVNDLLTVDGSRVRQYVSSRGMVFAVSWNTLYKPDLSAVLGAAFPTYAKAAQDATKIPGIQRHFRHESLDVVVQSTAHLHVFSGFAFRPSLVPKGVSPERLALE